MLTMVDWSDEQIKHIEGVFAIVSAVLLVGVIILAVFLVWG